MAKSPSDSSHLVIAGGKIKASRTGKRKKAAPVKADVVLDTEYIMKCLKDAKKANAPLQNKHQVALAVGVHDSQVKRWLDHEQFPDTGHFLKLALALRVDPMRLVGLVALAGNTIQSQLYNLVLNSWGESEARIISQITRLTKPEDRTAIADLVTGWVAAKLT